MLNRASGLVVSEGVRQTADGDRYLICGLTVQSQVPLPLPLHVPPAEGTPDWIIRLGREPRQVPPPPSDSPLPVTAPRQTNASPTDQNGIAFHYFQQGPDGTWLWWESLATVRVALGGRLVEVYPDPRGDRELLGLLLVGPVTAIVASQQGRALLHASAVVTPAGAVAFMGPKGQGKSTMAAAFLRRGAALLTDDMLLLAPRDDGVYGVPGPSAMKVWRATAEHTLGIGTDSLPSLTSSIEKKLLTLDGRYPVASTPVRLRRLYLLDRFQPGSEMGEGPSARRLSSGEAVARVAAQTYGPVLSPRAVAGLLPIYARLAKQAGVAVLRYPTGFDLQESTCRVVARDLEDG